MSVELSAMTAVARAERKIIEERMMDKLEMLCTRRREERREKRGGFEEGKTRMGRCFVSRVFQGIQGISRLFLFFSKELPLAGSALTPIIGMPRWIVNSCYCFHISIFVGENMNNRLAQGPCFPRFPCFDS